MADDPDCSETKSDSFSVFLAIFVPNESDETTLESELRDTFVPESTPTCSTECSSAPSTSCQLPCCARNRTYHPTVDELKKTSVRQTSSVGKQRQCPASIFLKYPWATYCLTQGGIACFYCKRASEKGQIIFNNYKENAFCAGTFSNWKKWQEKLKSITNLISTARQ